MSLTKLKGFHNIYKLPRKVLETKNFCKYFSNALEAEQTKESLKSTTFNNQKAFLKNIFAGIFDKEILVFPEVLSKNELEELDEKISKVKKYYEENKKEGSFNRTTIDKMNKLGLFGTNITATELMKLVEVLPQPYSDYVCDHHMISSKCIEKYGDDEIKEHVAEQLRGSALQLCIHEQHIGDDLSQISTEAEANEDGSTYLLRGQKLVICPFFDATQYFVVFAKVQNHKGHEELKSKPLTAFLVDKSTVDPSKFSINGPISSMVNPFYFPAHQIHLKDLEVPSSHVIGHVGTGFKIAVELMYGSLFVKTAHYASALRSTIGDLCAYVLQHTQFNKPMNEIPMIQEKIGDMCVDAYVMESMSFCVAGLFDSAAKNQLHGLENDTIVESACVQVYSSEHLRKNLESSLAILGANGSYEDNVVTRLLSQLPMHSPVGNDMLKRYIALNCLQHAGVAMQESLSKFRNPLNHLGFLVKKGWRSVLSSEPPLVHGLHHSVHPDLSICAESLETRVLKLNDLVVKYWTIFHNKLQEEEVALKRFADIAVDIFAITSCLARATRSKSIGLRNNDFEIMTVQAVVARLMKRIDDNMYQLDLGDHSNGDIYRLKVASQASKMKSYPLSHPLDRNW